MKQIKMFLLAGIIILTAATSSMGNTVPLANAGAIVTLNSNDSYDADGDKLDYSWTLTVPEGSSAILSKTTGKSSKFETDVDGSYVVELIASDGIVNSVPDTIIVQVGKVPVLLSSNVKKTRQTESYDANGNEVVDGSLKDDGFYQKGVTPHYSRDNTTKIVTDNLTGLMWQDDDAVDSVTMQWQTDANYETCVNNPTSATCYDTSGYTAATYCANLTLPSLNGYSDWRVPTSKELEGIVNYREVAPAINASYFINTSPNPVGYWSSTTFEGDMSTAWTLFFDTGSSSESPKNTYRFVRCVRDVEQEQ